MRKVPALAAIVVALAFVLSACTSAPAPPPPVETRIENSRSVALTGTITDGSGSVSGTFSIGAVRDEGGTLMAVGTFSSRVRHGDQETSGLSTISIPVVPAAITSNGGRTCGGLRLRLLPTEISLLGVTVRLDPALIDIVSAPANLVGNLPCRAAGLLQATGPETPRDAWFSCVLALAWPDGDQAVYEGRADGTLTWPPRGTMGFGYDPVFVPKGYDCTFAELDPQEKHRISHRADAFARLVADQFA